MSKQTNKLEKARERASNSLMELARAEAREKSRASARDTKRKILLGAAAETMMRTDENLRTRIESFMKGFLKRPVDLEAFDLVDSELNYFDRLGETADAEVEAAFDVLVDPTQPARPRLGATPSRSSAAEPGGSKVPPPLPTGAVTPSAIGNGQGPQARPPSHSTQS